MLFTTLKPQRCILQRHHPHARGLVAAWPMDDAGGKIVRDAAGTNHGTAVADGKWVPGPSGGTAMTFNGTSDYVDIGNPLGSTSAGTKTVEMWVNPSVASAGYFITNYDSQSAGFSVLFNTNRTLGISWIGTVNIVQTTDTLTLGTWYHITAVFNSGATGGIVYINGTVSKNGNLGTEATTTNRVRISGRWVTPNSGSGVVFTGSLDDVRIYNRALRAAEIAEIYRDPWALYRPPGINIYAATALAHIAAYRQLRRHV